MLASFPSTFEAAVKSEPAKNRGGVMTKQVRQAAAAADIGVHRARHLRLARAALRSADGARCVTVNEAESPLAWLARRKGRDGRALIDPTQLLAGERLRADFTRANAMPRMGADWSSPIGAARRGSEPGGNFSDGVLAARQRMRRALAAAGPEFQGVLLDVCCFLKGLEDIERSSGWPARSGKVVLQLGLDRLARHYGLKGEARGPSRTPSRTWFAEELSESVRKSDSDEGGAGVGADPLDHRT